jgi:hypothetical protein
MNKSLIIPLCAGEHEFSFINDEQSTAAAAGNSVANVSRTSIGCPCLHDFDVPL